MEGTFKRIIKARFSTPAKVLLSGEHAVVYGKPAIAFSIDRRTNCDVTVYEKQNCNKPFLDLECQFFKLEYDTAKDMESHSHLTFPEQVATKAFLHVAKKCLEDNKSSTTLDELSEKYSFKMKIVYDFPQGSGLGSSASFNVVLAGSVYTIIDKILNNTVHEHSGLDFAELEDLWKIKKLADYGEGYLHKSASGIDTSIVTLGGMIKFVKTQDASYIPKRLTPKFEFDFDVIYTGVSRSTSTTIESLETLKLLVPRVFDAIMDAIGVISDEVELILDSEEDNIDKLMTLVDTNHNCLRACGLSLPIVDELTVVAGQHKVALKITGAGSGGCLLAVYNNKSDRDGFRDAVKAFEDRNVTFVDTEKGSLGFQCEHWEY